MGVLKIVDAFVVKFQGNWETMVGGFKGKLMIASINEALERSFNALQVVVALAASLLGLTLRSECDRASDFLQHFEGIGLIA